MAKRHEILLIYLAHKKDPFIFWRFIFVWFVHVHVV